MSEMTEIGQGGLTHDPTPVCLKRHFNPTGSAKRPAPQREQKLTSLAPQDWAEFRVPPQADSEISTPPAHAAHLDVFSGCLGQRRFD